MNYSPRLLFIYFLFIGITIQAQQVGIGTTTPAASAILDVSSTSKGFLPPRMSKEERNSITNPVAGLIIWCTNSYGGPQLQVYNGSNWTNLMGEFTVNIGEFFQGGWVAYILQPGDPGFVCGETHGLIINDHNLGDRIDWGCMDTDITGAGGTALGTGNQNTIDIVSAFCSNPIIAAKLCSDLVSNGYSDWFLPSKDELSRVQLNSWALSDLIYYTYWSSTESDANNAWMQNFYSGFQFPTNKVSDGSVRAIRRF